MTEDIEIYRPPTTLEIARENTDDWFGAFGNIVKLAEFVADTAFVPDAMRRNPAAVAAAILTGREMHLPPMVSLRHLYVIKGRVGQSAELMRAQVFRAGHDIRYVETTDSRCVVEGRRKDGKEWTRVQFTAEDARNAAIDLRTYGADKLVARATSRLCRRLFPDVMSGLPTVDELEDFGAAEVIAIAEPDGGPAVTRRRAARKPKAAATRNTLAQPDKAADDTADLLDEPEPAPEPVEAETVTVTDDTDSLLAETMHPDQPPPDDADGPAPDKSGHVPQADETPPPPAPEPPGLAAEDYQPASPAQLKKIHALFNQRGFDTDNRQARIDLAASIIGRPIESSKQLTKDEASQVIDTLES